MKVEQIVHNTKNSCYFAVWNRNIKLSVNILVICIHTYLYGLSYLITYVSS